MTPLSSATTRSRSAGHQRLVQRQRQGPRGKVIGGGATGDGHRMFDFQILADRTFEVGDARPLYEVARFKHVSHGLQVVVLD